MLVTIRRNKYGRLAYATKIEGNLVTGWSTDPNGPAFKFEDAIAKQVVEAHEARGSVKGSTAGQLIVVGENGKVLATAGDPGEQPAPPKPLASLPGLAEEVAALRERVELIEASGDGEVKVEIDEKKLTAAIEAEFKKVGIPELVAKLVEAKFTAAANEAAAKAKTDPSKPATTKPDAAKTAPAG